MKTLLICGGVGGAKLAKGFFLKNHPMDILINVGDDFNHFGLHISPDIDTVMYTLADRVNQEQGWGLAEESWTTLNNIEFLDGETWFQLGDKDMATHLVRTQLLKNHSLTETTKKISLSFNLDVNLFPASDEPIETMIHSGNSCLTFQEYFVKQKAEPKVTSIAYRGLEKASLNKRIDLNSYDNFVICPSNPYLSIDPIIKIQELNKFLSQNKEKVFVVSPIVANRSLKGPTAKIMQSLNLDVNVVSIAKHYNYIAKNIFLDDLDKHYVNEISSLGMNAYVSKKLVMRSIQDKVSLAEDVIRILNG
jgi:LPPG:FO 2-phospho-L-lactate transferase